MFIMPLKVKSVPNEVNFWCKWFLYNYGQNWNFSSEKTSKLQILSYKRVIYLKRNLRTCTIQIHKEKSIIFWKKIGFWKFSIFFQRGDPLMSKLSKIDFPFFKNFKNKIEKWLLWDHSNMNRNKVMNFGGHCSYPVETTRLFLVIWAIMAPPYSEQGYTMIFSWKMYLLFSKRMLRAWSHSSSFFQN